MRCSFCLAVKELEQHGVGDVQSRQLFQRRRWHNDFSAIVEIFPLRAGEHDCGVAAVIFIEALWRTSSAASDHVVHRHGIVVLVIAIGRLHL